MPTRTPVNSALNVHPGELAKDHPRLKKTRKQPSSWTPNPTLWPRPWGLKTKARIQSALSVATSRRALALKPLCSAAPRRAAPGREH